MIDAEKNSQVDYTGSSTLYTTTDVNVRQEPGTGSGIVDGLGSGEAVTVVGETDNWYVVSVNGTIGYIFQVLSEFFSDTDGGKRR